MSRKIKNLILIIAFLLISLSLSFAYTINVDVSVWVVEETYVTTFLGCDEWGCHYSGECVDTSHSETQTISDNVPDGTPPEEIDDILDQIKEDSDIINEIKRSEEQPSELENDRVEAEDTITLDDLINNSDDIANNLITESETSTNEKHSTEGGDPVRLALGDFTTKYIDASYQYLKDKIEILRTYVSNNNSDHSFGRGWFFNYDTRIIHGVKPNSVEIADQAEIEANEAVIIYEETLIKYNKSMNDLIAIVGNDDG